jgi:hypothetical protein
MVPSDPTESPIEQVDMLVAGSGSSPTLTRLLAAKRR